MTKEKRILSYFIGWFLIGFIIMFIGINKIFASTYYMNYSYQQQYYDNNGSSVTGVTTTWVDSLNSYVSGNITTASGSYGAGLAITSPIPLLSGHTYSMSVYFENINNIALSSKNIISVASSLSASANDYANNIPGTEMLFSKVSNNTILQFVFKVDNNHTHIFFPWTTTSTTSQSYVLTQVVMEDLGSSGISQNEINQSLNSQTNEINNSIQNSTNIITGEIENLQDSIIDSNKETQDVIKDQFNDCYISSNLFDISKVPNTSTITNRGTDLLILNSLYNSTGKTLLELAPDLKAGNTYVLNFNTNSSHTYIYLEKSQLTWYNNGQAKTLTENDLNSIVVFYGLRDTEIIISNIQINSGTTLKSYEEYGEICTNRIDKTNDKLDDLNSSLNDSDSTGATDDASNFFSNFTTDTFGLTSIVTAPLNLINSLTSKTCSDLELPLPYLNNKTLTLPCMNHIYSRYFGNFFNLYQTITFGIVAYWVIVRIFNQVKDFKNPDHDEIEVLDL